MRDFPRFRMNDDREVTCYALLTEHLAGRDVRDIARVNWLAQRDSDDGCALLAQTLYEARVFDAGDVWRKARLSIESSRPRAAQKAAALLGDDVAKAVTELSDNPARYLSRKNATARGRTNAEQTALAIVRMAGNDADAAAGQLERRWQRELPAELAGWAWAQTAKQAALKLSPEASRVVPARRTPGRRAAPRNGVTMCAAGRPAPRCASATGGRCWRRSMR